MGSNDFISVRIVEVGERWKTERMINVEKGVNFLGYTVLDDGSLVKRNDKTNVFQTVKDNTINLQHTDAWALYQISEYNDEKMGDTFTLSKKDIASAGKEYQKEGSIKNLEYDTGAYRYATQGCTDSEMITLLKRYGGEKNNIKSVIELDTRKETIENVENDYEQSQLYQNMSIAEIAQDLWNEIKGLKNNNDEIIRKVSSIPTEKSAQVMQYYRDEIRNGKAGLIEDMSREWGMGVDCIRKALSYIVGNYYSLSKYFGNYNTEFKSNIQNLEQDLIDSKIGNQR